MIFKQIIEYLFSDVELDDQWNFDDEQIPLIWLISLAIFMIMVAVYELCLIHDTNYKMIYDGISFEILVRYVAYAEIIGSIGIIIYAFKKKIH